MRSFILAATFLYFGAAVDDVELIKPSQPPTLEQVLDSALPDWIGTADRLSFGD